MSTRPPAWNRHEAALLLEGFIDINKHGAKRNDVIKRVSNDLRKMAQNHGIEVDELYRNTNGITFQIQSMESAYCGYTVFKPATRLFTEIAELYKNNYLEFEKLLKEAKGMITENMSVESHFMEYLSQKMSPAQLLELYPCYSEIESFCIKINVLQKSTVYKGLHRVGI